MIDPADKYSAIADAADKLDKAQHTSMRWSDARGALPPGSSRAKVTTTNARWSQAAEHRDKCEASLDREIKALGYVMGPAVDRVALAISTLALLGWQLTDQGGINPAVVNLAVGGNGPVEVDRHQAIALFAHVSGLKFLSDLQTCWVLQR